MPAGYSGKPLAAKLGLKPGQRLLLLDAPAELQAVLSVEGIDRIISRSQGRWPEGARDVAHAFVTGAGNLPALLARLKAAIRPDGMIWISWPKRASGVATDVTEDVIRAQAIATGLVDVKVCAVDRTWSGLKLVVPVKDRPKPAGGVTRPRGGRSSAGSRTGSPRQGRSSR
ncbi:MAG: DUF3052 family protein [Alphaproteobacteria bacterium]|nr:DUF3052 family protein [Alphaproteobacteria bacterium]